MLKHAEEHGWFSTVGYSGCPNIEDEAMITASTLPIYTTYPLLYLKVNSANKILLTEFNTKPNLLPYSTRMISACALPKHVDRMIYWQSDHLILAEEKGWFDKFSYEQLALINSYVKKESSPSSIKSQNFCQKA